MKKLEILTLLCFAFTSVTANAMVFDNSEPMNDEELSNIRGGFVTSTGLQIDFGITNQIIVDSKVISEVAFQERNLSSLQNSDLQKRVEITNDGTNVSSLNLQNVPAFLSVIQNNVDNKLIQNFTLMDLNVSNIQAYKMVAMTPLLNYNNTLISK
jgi:hypothetical protein